MQRIPTTMQGPLLYVVRSAVAAAMIGSIISSWQRILRRDVVRHESFMIPAYALGQGQVRRYWFCSRGC